MCIQNSWPSWTLPHCVVHSAVNAMARSMSFIATTMDDERPFGIFVGNSHTCMPNTSNWRPELTREGINLSRSFAVNKLQTTCNLTTCSLAWGDSKGSSTNWSCSNWWLWEKDMLTSVWIKWLLWSFSGVHNGAQESSSFSLLQTFATFTGLSLSLSCPFLIGLNARGPSTRACRWRTVLQSSKVLLANTFKAIHYSGRPLVLSWLPFLPYSLLHLSRAATEGKENATPFIFLIFSSHSSRFWHIFSHRSSQDIPLCLLYDI